MGSKGKGRWRQTKQGNGNGPAIPKNAKGVLVTFEPTQEKPAIREAMDVLTTCCEELSGSSKEKREDGVSECDDAGKALEEELKELRGGSQSPLMWHETSAAGIVFISFKVGYGVFSNADAVLGCLADVLGAEGPGPIELVRHVLEKALDSGVSRTRHCIKFLPVLYSCNGQCENIEEMGKQLVATEFDSDEQATPQSFSVELDRRSLPGMSRSRVIDAFAKAVPQPPHSVDLTNPSKVIIAQVVRNSCTAAVMEGDLFRHLKKCNIRTCCEAFQKSKDDECTPNADDSPVEEVSAARVGGSSPPVGKPESESKEKGRETEGVLGGEQEAEGKAAGVGQILGKRDRSEDGGDSSLASRKAAAVGDQGERSICGSAS